MFVASGRINNVPVEFLLDTGATDVAVPMDLARQLVLPKGEAVTLNTANGRALGYRTRIDRLQLGAIVLRDVRAVTAGEIDRHGVMTGRRVARRLVALVPLRQAQTVAEFARPLEARARSAQHVENAPSAHFG